MASEPSGSYTTEATGTGVSLGTPLGQASKIDYSKPIDTKTKAITYSEGTPDLLLDLNSTASSTESKTGMVKAVKVRNDGYVPATALFSYSEYDSETNVVGTRYVQYMLNPSEEIILPTTRAIISDLLNEWDGTAVPATAPNTDEYVAVASFLDGAIADGNATTFNVDDNSTPVATTGFFYVGDKIRIEDEIMEITAVGANTGEQAQLTVIRGVDGSSAVAHGDNTAIRLPFYNMYHHFNKYTLTQSDDLGRYKATNLAGYGRANSGQTGITIGSVALQFYTHGESRLGLSDVTANSESGLTSGTTYYFKIAVDGSTPKELSFVVDSTKFGGSTGVVAKIQASIDAEYYTEGDMFQKKVSVVMTGGDIVFRGHTHLSSSSVVLSAGTSGSANVDELFDGTNQIGRIPATPIQYPSRLEQESTFNPVTNSATYKDIFVRDDGNGNLIWANRNKCGTINYETGAIDFVVPERPNAEFVVALAHSGPFSGKLDPTTASKKNGLIQVLANTPQQKCEAKLTVETF